VSWLEFGVTGNEPLTVNPGTRWCAGDERPADGGVDRAAGWLEEGVGDAEPRAEQPLATSAAATTARTGPR
jgi:hypothetical protein